MLVRSWPGPRWLPGSVRAVIVSPLDGSAFCYRLASGDSAGEAGNDESSERDQRGEWEAHDDERIRFENEWCRSR